PYPLMVFAGILPWTFFSTALSEASNSLINNETLISKVYFPSLIVPTATIVVPFAVFPNQLLHFARVDGLVQFLTGLANFIFAIAYFIRLLYKPRSISLDCCSQCKVSGFPIRPFPCADRSLCVTRRIQFKYSSSALAVVVLT